MFRGENEDLNVFSTQSVNKEWGNFEMCFSLYRAVQTGSLAILCSKNNIW